MLALRHRGAEPALFAKEWPRKELDGLTARESEGQKVILPVWHGIDEALRSTSFADPGRPGVDYIEPGAHTSRRCTGGGNTSMKRGGGAGARAHIDRRPSRLLRCAAETPTPALPFDKCMRTLADMGRGGASAPLRQRIRPDLPGLTG